MKRSIGMASLVLAAMAGLAGVKAQDKKSADGQVYELRTYYAHPGRMQAMHERFRKHTCKIFEKHGMKLVGFWSPLDATDADERMIYMLSFPSKEAADKSWKSFNADPDWKAVKAASEKDGPIVKKVDRVFMKGTDYSPMK